MYTNTIAIPINAILARVIKDTPGWESVIAGLANIMSSGESSLVKASLKVTAAVVSAAPMDPARSLGNRGNPQLETDCKFHKKVIPVSAQKIIL